MCPKLREFVPELPRFAPPVGRASSLQVAQHVLTNHPDFVTGNITQSRLHSLARKVIEQHDELVKLRKFAATYNAYDDKLAKQLVIVKNDLAAARKHIYDLTRER